MQQFFFVSNTHLNLILNKLISKITNNMPVKNILAKSGGADHTGKYTGRKAQPSELVHILLFPHLLIK